MQNRANIVYSIKSNNVIYYKDLLQDLEMAIMSETATEKDYSMFMGLQGWYFNNMNKANII